MLALVVFVLPVAFTALDKNSLWVNFMFLFTHTGGKYGTLVLTLLASFFYAYQVPVRQKKIFVFVRSVVTILLFLSVPAFLNEHYTKPLFKEIRPAHQFLLTQTNSQQMLSTWFDLNKQQRHDFLEKLITNHQALFINIDVRVLEHWIEESGLSFPSGHSYNSFLLATIIALSLYQSRKQQLNRWFWLPFVWAFSVAFSRVALGAHTEVDVTVGALCGVLTAVLFFYLNLTRKILWFKRY
ncbi:MAG: phosphatase PAP2 family protein [Bacteroidia bacterium]|nr:phosphatase PAP2 family protein [Bacteroidia bacterium]